VGSISADWHFIEIANGVLTKHPFGAHPTNLIIRYPQYVAQNHIRIRTERRRRPVDAAKA
jgi:hypothetical protein